MRSRNEDIEVEETILIAGSKVAELRRAGGERRVSLAMSLERMAHALSLALVAEVEPRLLARLHLRLETALRSAEIVDATFEEMPASQRPTTPPPPGETPLDVWEREKPYSERPTVPPAAASRARTVSDVIPRVDAEGPPSSDLRRASGA